MNTLLNFFLVVALTVVVLQAAPSQEPVSPTTPTVVSSQSQKTSSESSESAESAESTERIKRDINSALKPAQATNYAKTQSQTPQLKKNVENNEPAPAVVPLNHQPVLGTVQNSQKPQGGLISQ